MEVLADILVIFNGIVHQVGHDDGRRRQHHAKGAAQGDIALQRGAGGVFGNAGTLQHGRFLGIHHIGDPLPQRLRHGVADVRRQNRVGAGGLDFQHMGAGGIGDFQLIQQLLVGGIQLQIVNDLLQNRPGGGHDLEVHRQLAADLQVRQGGDGGGLAGYIDHGGGFVAGSQHLGGENARQHGAGDETDQKDPGLVQHHARQLHQAEQILALCGVRAVHEICKILFRAQAGIPLPFRTGKWRGRYRCNPTQKCRFWRKSLGIQLPGHGCIVIHHIIISAANPFVKHGQPRQEGTFFRPFRGCPQMDSP